MAPPRHHSRWFGPLCAIVTALSLSACAHRPSPGEKIVECGPLYELRARQLDPPGTSAGVATILIVTVGRYEEAPDIQIRLNGPSGRFYVNGSPRQFGFTDDRGKLVVEWHAPEKTDGSGPTETSLEFMALDLPGDCRIVLPVQPGR